MPYKKTFNPTIELERTLSEQIYKSLQGQVVEEVIKLSKIEDSENYMRSAMEGGSLKVDERLLSHYYQMFNGVKEKLGFDDKVDFYISGSSEVNAWSLYSEDGKSPHIVNVNSGLIQLMTDQELAFVIGHELGHLINKNTKLQEIIRFVFPKREVCPLALGHKIRLWEQLAELEADRFGYLATEDLYVCVSAFYKLASGLDITKMNVQIDVLLEENLKHLEYFSKEGSSSNTHPVNPIRVQALNLFASTKSDKTLDKQMDELINILLKIGTSELDFHISVFLASAGLFVANLDGKVTGDEIEQILTRLSNFQMFAKDFLDKVNDADVPDLVVKSVSKILDIDASLRDSLMNYLIDIVIADKNFTKDEIEFLYGQGKNLFGFSEKEVAKMIAENIQENYVPNIFDIA